MLRGKVCQSNAIFDEQGQQKRSGQPAMNRSKQAGMGKKAFCLLLISLTLASVHLAEGQQPGKIPRIGVLVPTSPSFFAARIKAFQQGLHEHGYVEGKNIMLEYRYAEGKVDRFPELATELVGLKVEVIVTANDATVQAAKKASSIIPIVFTTVSDPVGSGLVASLAQPGGNATGLTIMMPELGTGKGWSSLRKPSLKSHEWPSSGQL